MSKQQEALRLALEALRDYRRSDDDRVSVAMGILQEALAEQPAQQEPVSDRENAIIRFALHQFMSNAYSNMNAAAQDKDSRHYTMGAVEKFAKDAKDAEALLSRLQFKAPQPAQQYCKLCGDSFSNFNLEGAVCGDCAHGIEKPVLAEQPAQPSKPWVELTDEDIQEVRESCGITHHAIKTIEAKLREKNA